MSPAEICALLHEMHPPAFDCSPAPGEAVRVRTPMLYPDGGIIDVFVLPRQGSFDVTDFGEALGWLRLQSPSGQLSPRQKRLLRDVCLTLGVELSGWQLFKRVQTDDLPSAVLRVAQAALRVSDLWFTMRTRAFEVVAEEVADWLEERRIPFDRSVVVPGRSGRSWTIDFRTTPPQRTSLVFVLATGSRSAARRLTEHVVAGLHDLSHLKHNQADLAFVSLFDDTEDVWKEEDFRIVETLSVPARWSRRDEFERILQAA